MACLSVHLISPGRGDGVTLDVAYTHCYTRGCGGGFGGQSAPFSSRPRASWVGEPRALRRRPGDWETGLHADDVVTLDQGAAVVILDRLGARARRLVRHVADRT